QGPATTAFSPLSLHDALPISRLRPTGAALVVEERLEDDVFRRVVLVGCAQVAGTLAWVAVDEIAAPAAHHVERRVLRERQAIREPLWRCSGHEARPVVLPELLHFTADGIRIGDDRMVVRAANGAGGQLEGRHLSSIIHGFLLRRHAVSPYSGSWTWL